MAHSRNVPPPAPKLDMYHAPLNVGFSDMELKQRSIGPNLQSEKSVNRRPSGVRGLRVPGLPRVRGTGLGDSTKLSGSYQRGWSSEEFESLKGSL